MKNKTVCHVKARDLLVSLKVLVLDLQRVKYQGNPRWRKESKRDQSLSSDMVAYQMWCQIFCWMRDPMPLAVILSSWDRCGNGHLILRPPDGFLLKLKCRLVALSGLSLQDLRALTLLLSVHTPKQLNLALIPTLQELLSKCRTCQQQKNSLQEQEAKDRKTKGLSPPVQAWSDP